ncbi:tetratricopeptide (TPR) repeat protein [Pontibacter aydingkolensis]|uniref:Tetratricopeptide repeat protein n=1 Tax=Pontibacter aydingkolensis TaxID=1911536 RepID=A0ABS7CX99_9BACT|nr:tetratricopeptide repeat protein [Pontibacter aydingkolensis]MBW7468494.1 tetratricopeptide repeat protein [Pontibacter aydingkolensis]
MPLKRLSLLWGLVLLTSVSACDGEEANREERMVNLSEVKDDEDAQLKNLNAAIEQSRRDGSLYARRAVVLLRKGELEKALSDANEAVNLTKNEPSTLFVKAQVLRALNRQEEALPLALQAERNSYQSSSLYVLLGELYLQRKEYKQAKVYLDKAQKLSPTDAYAFYYKGRVQEATGDTARAVRNYKLALEQLPDFMQPQRELAGILVNRGDYDAARPYLNAAQKLDAKDARLWYYKGLLYQATQKQDSAMLSFNRAVALNDTLYGAHYRLGMAAYLQGRTDTALVHLEKVYPKYEQEVKYLSTLAGAYERTGRNIKALQTYQQLVEVEPRYTYGYQAISRLKYKLTRPMPDSTAVRREMLEQ